MEILAHAVTGPRTALVPSLVWALTAFACLSPATLLRAQPDPSDLLLRLRHRVPKKVDRRPRHIRTVVDHRQQVEAPNPAGIRPMPDVDWSASAASSSRWR